MTVRTIGLGFQSGRGNRDMKMLRLVFWWFVSLAALGSAVLCLQTALSKPWLTSLYTSAALALVAGLLANPLIRPRVGLGTRPIVTLALLAVLAVAGLWSLLLVTDQAMFHSGSRDSPERIQAVTTLNNGLAGKAGGDYVSAAAFFEQACSKGVAEDCFNHGQMNEDSLFGINRLDVARASYGKACDQYHTAACNNLGVMMLRGEGGPVDREAGIKLFARACEGGSADGCENQRVTAGTPAAG